MPQPARPLVVALLLACPASASAHVGAGAGQTDVLLPPGGPSAILVTEPFGLLTSQDGGGFTWVCHEVLSAPGGSSLLPRFAVADDGTLLGVVGQLDGVVTPGVSLYRSDDGGCSFTPVAGLDGHLVADAAFLPGQPAVAVAVTADLGEGVGNGVHRSIDGGRSWEEVAFAPGRIQRSVLAGPGGRVYAVSIALEPPAAFLARSDDGGAQFTERALTPPDGASPLITSLLAVDPVNPDELWVRFDGDAGDRALRSLDGGATWLAPEGLPEIVLDLTLTPDGGALLAGGARNLYASSDRAVFTRVDSTAQIWGGATAPALGFVAALNTLSEDDAVAASQDGGRTFASLLRTTEIEGPRVCAPDSDVARVCGPLWPVLQENLARLRPTDDDDDDDSAAPPPPSDCAGCSDGSLAALLPLLVLPGRRRRQPQSRVGSPDSRRTIR